MRQISLICLICQISLISAHPAFAAFPASQNYRLDEWSIGAGGSDRSQSTNYKTETIADPAAGDPQQSTTYRINPGLIAVEMANVPPAPTFTNPSDWYNKLKLILNPGSNPSDTKFAVAISTDNFLTTNYVKADNSIGATLTAADWRTYVSWGSGTGINVIGLNYSTTYQVKVKAVQGDFTESGWGPLASAATAPPAIEFDIDAAETDIDTDPPYEVSFGTMTAGSVLTAANKIWVDFTTNADSGGVVYITGTNGGLKSMSKDVTIAAVSADLSGQPEGFGLRAASSTQADGGPFTPDAPFNGAGNTVGSTGITLIPLATTLTPMTDGRLSTEVKAKISTLTAAATDYTETVTIVAAGTF